MEPANTVYIQYNRCDQDPEEAFRRFAAEISRLIAAKHPDKIAVDLRNNAGGDSRVFRPLIDVLKKERKARVYALIGPGTFGSGFFALWDLKTVAHAIAVGEPTGSKPNSFGEQRNLVLPNSGLTLTYSTRYYRFEKTERPAFEPDRKITMTSADFLSGRDPLMDWIQRQ